MRIYTAVMVVCCLLILSTGYSQSADSIPPEPTVFTAVEKEAEFPGGGQGWRSFLEKNLNPAVPVEKGAPVGLYRVIVQFIVDKNGEISDIEPVTRLGYGMEQEVVRILKKSGAWEPAIMNGRPVRAYRKQPVVFMVTEDGFDITLQPLYAGEDNEINIEVEKVKNEDLFVTISKGTIKRNSNGKFTVRVTGTDRVIVKVYNAKKDNKELGTASLEVRKR